VEHDLRRRSQPLRRSTVDVTEEHRPVRMTRNGLRFIEWVTRSDAPSPLLELMGIPSVEDESSPELFDGAQALVASDAAHVKGEGLELCVEAASLGVVMDTLRCSVSIIGTKGDAVDEARIVDGDAFRVLLSTEPPGLVTVGLVDAAVPLSDVVVAAVDDLLEDGADLVTATVDMPDRAVAFVVDSTTGTADVSMVDAEGGRSAVGPWGSVQAAEQLVQLMDEVRGPGS